MKVLFTGLGSIGKRHLKNLGAVAQKKNIALEIWALRSSDAPLPQEIADLLTGQLFDEAELTHYDVAFVTNPTSLHAQTLHMLKGKADALFIEKPIFSDPHEVLADCLLPGQKAYVAAPMRWCGVMLALKRHLEQLRPYSARVICSSYLPDWRPGVDYRTVDLFGMPLETFHFKGTYSDLEIDSDDLSVYIARYENMLAEVHLDYFGRTYRRSIELFCQDGTCTADFGAGVLTLPDGTEERYEEPVNERYLREMDYFLDYVQAADAQESVNTPQTAQKVLRLTLGEEG